MSLPQGKADQFINQCDIMGAPFLIFQSHPDDYRKISDKTVTNDTSCDYILQKVYYDPKNINLIQKSIIREVYIKSNKKYLIDRQSDQDLLVVMRWVFLEYARHLPTNIREQIQELNNRVVNEVVPDIISGLDSHYSYLNSVFGVRNIMEYSINTSSRGSGEKLLPSTHRCF